MNLQSTFHEFPRRSALAGLTGIAGAAMFGSIHQALAQEGLQLSRLSQMAFVFEDIENGAKNFSDLLGKEIPNIITTDPLEKAKTRYQGKPTEARAKLAFFGFGEVQFELIEPIGGPSTWQEHLQRHGEGVHHVAFNVSGMNKALEILDQRGFPTVQSGEFTGGRYAYVDTTAAFTVLTELLEFD